MIKDINDEIYEKLKKSKVGSRVDPTFDKIKFNKKMAKFYEIRKFILEKDARIRIFLVLSLKNITWYRELKNKYDIHPRHLTEFFEFLKGKNIVLFKPLSEVSDVLFESVIQTQSSMFYSKRDEVKVYTLSPEGQLLAQELTEEIIKLSNKREGLQMHISDIMARTANHRHAVKKLQELENLHIPRKIIYPDGITIYRESQASKNLKLSVKKFFQELKFEKLNKQKNLLLQQPNNSNQIVSLDKQIQSLSVLSENKENNVYKGKFQHLSTLQFEALCEGNLHYNEEANEYMSTKDIEFELKKSNAKDDIIKYHENYISSKDARRFFCKGYHNDDSYLAKAPNKPMSIEDEADAVLNSML